MDAILEAVGIGKSFLIPSVRRDTLREHVFAAFEPRRFERLQVLEDVSFAVPRGTTFGIMGRNGCGKSTLLKILCEIYQPDRGSVHTRAGLTPILELGVGWNTELDAIDNVCLLGSVMGLGLREIRARLDDILGFAELERFANLQLKHYSSGMASRLAYAVAFHAVREILVLDEIFAVGDAGFKSKCEERYRRLHADGHTVVLVTHEPRIVTSYCDRAILVEAGRVRYEGSGAEVAARYLEMATG
jgi:ABC-type polysaccharide/polyol phosphate transport system ATPase subunit